MFKKLLAYSLLSLLIVGCISFNQAKPAHNPENWDLPGIQAALMQQQPLLQGEAIRYLSKRDRTQQNPPKELVEKVRSLKTDPQLAIDFLTGVQALANLGESIQADEAKLLQLIQNKAPNVINREQAIALLPYTNQPARHQKLLIQLATQPQEHVYVKYHAALALSQLGTADVVPDLVEILRDRRENPWVRGSAALSLSQLGDVAKPYLPEMGDFLRGKTVDAKDQQSMEYQNGRVMTGRALSRWGDATKDYLPDIFKWVQINEQSVTFHHEGMADVLADYGPTAHGYIPQLITMLEQPEQSGIALPRAIEILGKWGDAAKPALPQLKQLAQNCNGEASLAIARIAPNDPNALPNALRCLKEAENSFPNAKWAAIRRKDLHQALEVWAKQQGGLDVKTISPIIDHAKTPEDWLLAYRLSGGRSDVLALIQRQLDALPKP